MTPRLKKYSLSPGDRLNRFTLVPPEPIQRPEFTQRWGRTQSAAVVVTVCAVVLVIGEIAALLMGVP